MRDYMTATQVIKEFEEHILPAVVEQYGEDDEVAIDEAFNNYTDSLCKDGHITYWLYNDITYDGDDIDELDEYVEHYNEVARLLDDYQFTPEILKELIKEG